MRWLLLLTLALSTACGDLGKRYPKVEEVQTFDADNLDLYDSVVGQYVDESGDVNYSGWRSNRADLVALRNLFLKLSLVEIEDFSPNEQAAFYINAHNIIVTWLVLWKYNATGSGTHTEFRSIFNLAPPDEQDVFSLFEWRIGEQLLTLTQLRKEVLGSFGDPRLFLALHCAAKGCPPMLGKAVRPENLEEILAERTLEYVNNQDAERTNMVFVDNETQTIRTPEYMNWQNMGDLKAFVLKHLDQETFDPAQVSSFEVTTAEFDWGLSQSVDGGGEDNVCEVDPSICDPPWWEKVIDVIKDVVDTVACDWFGRIIEFEMCKKTTVDPHNNLNETRRLVDELKAPSK